MTPRKIAMAVAGLAFAAAGHAMVAPAIAATGSPASAQSSPLPAADGSYQVAQSCGWYVILNCAKSRSGASSYGAPILWTNNYPNFRNGWYCGYDGPHGSRAAANQARLGWLEAVRSAYVKSAC